MIEPVEIFIWGVLALVVVPILVLPFFLIAEWWQARRDA